MLNPFNRNLRPPFRFPPENVQSFANSLGALHVLHPAVYVSVKHIRTPWRRPATSMFSRLEKLSSGRTPACPMGQSQ